MGDKNQEPEGKKGRNDSDRLQRIRRLTPSLALYDIDLSGPRELFFWRSLNTLAQEELSVVHKGNVSPDNRVPTTCTELTTCQPYPNSGAVAVN